MINKKVLGFLLVLLIGASTPVHARKFVVRVPLKDTDGTAISSYSLGGSGYVTTAAIESDQFEGFSSIIVNSSASTNIYYQLSMDGATWYDPYTTDGSTLTSAGSVVATLNSNRWIVFTARLAKYCRFIFKANSASTISADMIYLEGTH